MTLRHAINWQTMKPVCGGGGERDLYVLDMTRVGCAVRTLEAL
jgi:hypothetical protein